MVTFDTMSFIWGIQQTSRPSQSHMIDWTRQLIKDLDKRIKISITSIVIGEYLAHFDADDLAVQLASIQRDFVVLPYDARAASIAAQLWQKRHEIADPPKRNVLKADIQILGCAIAGGAKTIYSHDEDIHKLATISGQIIAKNITDPSSGKLF